MSTETKFNFRTAAKLGSVAIMVLLVIAVLGPAKWAPRTELGWQFDHFIGVADDLGDQLRKLGAGDPPRGVLDGEPVVLEP